MTQNDERNRNNRHKHPDQKSIGPSVKTFFYTPKYCGDHIETTPSQLADTHRRAPTLESPCKKPRWWFDFQHFCSSLAHVRNKHPNTGESTDNKTHRITYRPTRKSTNTGNANRSTRHEKDFSGLAQWKPHRDASRLEPTWWHTFSRSKAGISNTCEQQR